MESAEWGKMAVFLYAAAITHLFGDLLSHWMEKKRKSVTLGLALLYLYSLFYPVIFMAENQLLVVACPLYLTLADWFSMVGVAEPGEFHLEKRGEKETTLVIITLGIDQALHLFVLFVVALFVFS